MAECLGTQIVKEMASWEFENLSSRPIDSEWSGLQHPSPELVGNGKRKGVQSGRIARRHWSMTSASLLIRASLAIGLLNDAIKVQTGIAFVESSTFAGTKDVFSDKQIYPSRFWGIRESRPT